MKGRLRVVGGDSVLWREVPTEYWHEIIEDGKEFLTIETPILPHGSEIPFVLFF